MPRYRTCPRGLNSALLTLVTLPSAVTVYASSTHPRCFAQRQRWVIEFNFRIRVKEASGTSGVAPDFSCANRSLSAFRSGVLPRVPAICSSTSARPGWPVSIAVRACSSICCCTAADIRGSALFFGSTVRNWVT